MTFYWLADTSRKRCPLLTRSELHCVWKSVALSHSSISLLSVDRFAKLFYWPTLRTVCNKLSLKIPPHLKRISYKATLLNVQNHDVVSQKNAVTLQQWENIKCRLASVCMYELIIRVWNFALKLQAVAQKMANYFRGYFLPQPVYIGYNFLEQSVNQSINQSIQQSVVFNSGK